MSKQIITHGDCVQGMMQLPTRSVDLIVADPPYNLGKDYGNKSDTKTWFEYRKWMREWLREAKRILKPSGSIYVFMGVQYIAELYIQMREEFFFNGWITWHYTQGVGKTRGFSPRHEDILFFTKSKDFRFYLSAIRQPQKADRKINNSLGANPGDVWSIPHIHWNKDEKEGHPTQKPEAVIERIIMASSCPGDMVIDPFSGSGTTAIVCLKNLRNFQGWELNPIFVKQSINRLTRANDQLV